MFKTDFATFVCEDDTISCTVDGVDYQARVIADEDTTPMDYDAPGWVFDIKDPVHGAQNRAIIEAWKNDEWRYVTVVIDAEVEGWEWMHVTSLSGIEVNFPFGEEGVNPNLYLRDAANEMLKEAVPLVRASLAKLNSLTPT